MVDRAFNIGDLVLQHDAKLHMPPFMRRQDGKAKTLSQSEILKTRNITSLRIHIKHAVARMKNFRILFLPLLYQTLVMVAVFCNMPLLLKY